MTQAVFLYSAQSFAVLQNIIRSNI